MSHLNCHQPTAGNFSVTRDQTSFTLEYSSASFANRIKMAPGLVDDSYGHCPQPEPAISSGKPAANHTPGSTVTSFDGLYTPSPSRFVAECHPLEKQITAEVDSYFLEHWPFKTDKDRKKFVAAGFSRVTCLYFPKALDDRIGFASMLLTVLFLIDGM